MRENYDKCEGCNCFYPDGHPIDKSICMLIRRRYYKYISEKCPCQTCLVKVTCTEHPVAKKLYTRKFCEKIYKYFNGVFKLGMIYRRFPLQDGSFTKIKSQEYIVREKVRNRFKLKEIKS